jgi:hypothetical protein
MNNFHTRSLTFTIVMAALPVLPARADPEALAPVLQDIEVVGAAQPTPIIGARRPALSVCRCRLPATVPVAHVSAMEIGKLLGAHSFTAPAIKSSVWIKHRSIRFIHNGRSGWRERDVTTRKTVLCLLPRDSTGYAPFFSSKECRIQQ